MGSELTAEDYIGFDMYNRELGFYFYSTFFNNISIKKLLVRKYSLQRPKVFKNIDAGNIYLPGDEMFDSICSIHNIKHSDALVCYAEKQRGGTLVLRNDCAIVYTPSKNREIFYIDDSTELSALSLKTGIDISDTMFCLIKELNTLITLFNRNKGTVLTSFSDKFNHPIDNTTYSECQLHLKMLCLFCFAFGITTHQVCFLSRIACAFEISSYKLEELLVTIAGFPVENNLNILKSLFKEDKCSDKNSLLADLIYLVVLGAYDVEAEYKALEFIAALLNVSNNKVFEAYYKLKEIG